MKQVTLKLILKSKQYEIPHQFKTVSDIKTDIYYQLLIDPNHKYDIESNVSDENFQQFINYLVYKKDPIVTMANYHDFYQLGQEFDLTKFNEIVQKTMKNWDKCELNLFLLNDSAIKDKFIIEEKISQNLDEYIVKYGSQLMNVNIHSLVNIFNNPNKKFTEHDKAYCLIKQHYNNTKNDSVFVLLPKIDGNKLSELNFEDTITSVSDRFGYMANINYNYFNIAKEISNLIRTNQEQEKTNLKLNNELNDISNKLSQLKDEFISYKKEYEEKYLLQEKRYNEQLQFNEKIKNDLNEIHDQNHKTNNEFNSFKIQNETMLQKQNEINDKQKIINDEQNKQNDQLNKRLNNDNEKIDDIAKQFQSYKIKLEEIIQKKNDNEQIQRNQILEQLNTIKETLSKTSNENHLKKVDTELSKLAKTVNIIQKENNDRNQNFKRRINRMESNIEFKVFKYAKGNELYGIIEYLTEKTGGNVHDNETINIKSSSNQPSFLYYRHNPRYLCDFGDLSSHSMWSPDGEKNSNLLFDFKTRKIKLTDYTFHTPTNRTSDYPKSWIVQCSNDSNNWVTVDDRDDESIMNNCNVCHTFKCKNFSNDFYQYIKITSKGPCWNSPSRHYFDLSAIEFFGKLYE